MGFADDLLLEERMQEVRTMLDNPDSTLDKSLLEERLAKLSGGIARLEVGGPSNGERKEKRDRAEDAVCAVRGAMKHGVLPGGAWTLLRLCGTDVLPQNEFNDKILRPAFQTPFLRLLENSGIMLDSHEVVQVLGPILEGIRDNKPLVYDFLEQKHVDPYSDGILDSTPAVMESIRNAISCASQIGTLGGCVVFKRDGELERKEARATQDWLRNANYNPADERI
jgi:chaperonin GroEL